MKKEFNDDLISNKSKMQGLLYILRKKYHVNHGLDVAEAEIVHQNSKNQSQKDCFSQQFLLHELLQYIEIVFTCFRQNCLSAFLRSCKNKSNKFILTFIHNQVPVLTPLCICLKYSNFHRLLKQEKKTCRHYNDILLGG